MTTKIVKRVVTKKLPAKPKRPASTPRPAPAHPAGGANGVPAGIRVRMYRVGFGDFFLLTVRGADGTPLHVLIDCGVHAANLNSIGAAIDQLAKDTGGRLALVIMTHRHADHISGFGTGKDAFSKFTVERVWMSWFENPKSPAAAKFQATLTALAANLQLTLAARSDPRDAEYIAMANNITGDMSATGAAGAGGGNAAALATLHGGFANKAPVDYYQAGDTPALPDSLIKAGLTAQILGPPIDPQLVAQMDGKGHQYLAANADDGTPPNRFHRVFRTDAKAYPAEAFELFGVDEIQRRVAAVQPDLLAAKAAQADNTINNQSLVVLFGFGGKTMLFSGDAQWGNWENFLFGGALGSAGHTALSSASKTILGKIDFYKVGHHGSTNATPIDALNAMRDGCVAMCSTQPGAYGSTANNSEVPRVPLLAALDKKTNHQIARSDQVAVPGAPPIADPLPNVFTKSAAGYIDYEM